MNRFFNYRTKPALKGAITRAKKTISKKEYTQRQKQILTTTLNTLNNTTELLKQLKATQRKRAEKADTNKKINDIKPTIKETKSSLQMTIKELNKILKEENEYNDYLDHRTFNFTVQFYRTQGANSKIPADYIDPLTGNTYIKMGNEFNEYTHWKNIKRYELNRTYAKPQGEQPRDEPVKTLLGLRAIHAIEGERPLIFSDYLVQGYTTAFMITDAHEEEEAEAEDAQEQIFFNDITADKAINSYYNEYYLNDNKNDSLYKPYYFEHSYLKDNFIKGSCGLTSLIYAFYDRCKTLKYKELTYKRVCEILKIDFKPEGNMGVYLRDLQKITDVYPFKIIIFDKMNNVINQFYQPHTHIEATAYLQIYNKHITPYTANLTELTKRLMYKKTSDNIHHISDNYNFIYTPEKEKATFNKGEQVINKWLFSVLCFEELINKIIELGKPEKKITYKCRVGDECTLKDILFFCYFKRRYVPSVTYTNNLKVIRITSLKNINIIVETYNTESGRENPEQNIYFLADEKNGDNKNDDDTENGDDKYDETEFINKILKVEALKKQFYMNVVKSEYLSSLNNDVRAIHKEYKINVDILNFENSNDEPLYGLDDNKAYTSRLNEIKEIPVIKFFDNYEPYDGGELNDYFYYLVEMTGTPDMYDYIIFNGCKNARIMGILLKMVNPTKYFIKYVLKTHTIKKSFKEEIKNMYSEKIEDVYKKDIVNRAIGCLEIKNNYHTVTDVYNNIKEATAYKNKLIENGEHASIKRIEDNDNKLYIVISEAKKETHTNLTPLKELILTMQKIRLMTNMRKLNNNNITVYGIKTDCIFFSQKYHDKVKGLFDIKKHTDLYNSLGGYKIEYETRSTEMNLNIKSNQVFKIAEFKPIIKQFDDEYNINNIVSYIKNTGNMLIKSKYAGCGKSYITTKMTDDKNKAVYITPTNILCKAYKIKQFNSKTIYKFLGLGFDGQKATNLNKEILNKKEDYDIIIFDEIYLYKLSFLQLIYKRMLNNPKKIFIATGDPLQKDAINENPEYIKRAIDYMFNNQIYLTKIKRTDDPDSVKRIMGIWDDIFNNNITDVKFLCEKYNIKTINDYDDITTEKHITFFKDERRDTPTAEGLNKMMLKRLNKNKFDVGLFIMVKERFIKDGYIFYNNFEYEIINNVVDGLIIKDEDDNKFNITHEEAEKHFKSNFALTLDSLQGATIDEPYTIYNSHLRISGIKHFYTAITRTTNLNNITVCLK